MATAVGQAHAFYVPDALYAVGHNRFEGEEKIRAFYARRRQRGNSNTRHLLSNLRVFRDDARHARAVGVMSRYAPTVARRFRVRPPALIADFEAQCVLGGDRLWRFQSHVLRPIFVGSDTPIFDVDRPATPMSAPRVWRTAGNRSTCGAVEMTAQAKHIMRREVLDLAARLGATGCHSLSSVKLTKSGVRCRH